MPSHTSNIIEKEKKYVMNLTVRLCLFTKWFFARQVSNGTLNVFWTQFSVKFVSRLYYLRQYYIIPVKGYIICKTSVSDKAQKVGDMWYCT